MYSIIEYWIIPNFSVGPKETLSCSKGSGSLDGMRLKTLEIYSTLNFVGVSHNRLP